MGQKLTRAVIAVFSSIVLVFWGFPAQAVSPASGPSTGGTTVTVDGIQFVQVAAANSHSLGLTNKGTLYAWGLNPFGALGNNTITASSVPVQVLNSEGTEPLTGVTAIEAGDSRSYAITSDGLFAWGSNADGQLGDGTTIDRLLPVKVKGPGGSGFLTNVTAVSALQGHTLAISNSQVYGWGSNFTGGLGQAIAEGSNSLVPLLIPNLPTNATGIAVGSGHSLAIIGTQLYAWGLNDQGQLGISTNYGTTTRVLTPTAVQGVGGSGTLSGVSAISSGTYSSFAKVGDKLISFGNGAFGQLGNATNTRTYIPGYVKTSNTDDLSGITELASGFDSMCAVTDVGVYCWGSGILGSLGNGGTSNSNVAVRVLGLGGAGFLAPVASIDCGQIYCVASNQSGVVGWGTNSDGQLGFSTPNDFSSPELGPNFEAFQLLFGNTPGTTLTNSSNVWRAVSPPGSAGPVTITAVANVFGGITPGDPATTSWTAGTFTYEAALAQTGSRELTSMGIFAAVTIFSGVIIYTARRRSEKH